MFGVTKLTQNAGHYGCNFEIGRRGQEQFKEQVGVWQENKLLRWRGGVRGEVMGKCGDQRVQEWVSEGRNNIISVV